MQNRTVNKFAKSVLKLGKKAMPGILVGSGMVVTWFSGFQAGLAKPKADVLIAERKKELGVEKLGIVETVKTTAPVYAPAAVAGAVGAGMAIGGFTMEASRVAAATSMAKAAAEELSSYKEESEKVMTDEQKQEVQQKVDEAKIKKAKKPSQKFQNETTVRGDEWVLGYEPISHLWFHATRNDVDKAVTAFDKKLVAASRRFEGLSVADWVYTLSEYVKFEHDDFTFSRYDEERGWNSDITGEFYIKPTSQMMDGIPCLVIDPGKDPTYEYSKYNK